MSSPSELAKLAQEYQTKGEYAKAIESYSKVIEVAPDIAEIHVNKGCCESSLGMQKEALASFTTALNINPTLPNAHCNKANILKTMGKKDEALASFKEACKIEPAMKFAWFGQSVILNSLERYEEALECIENSIKREAGKVDIPARNERAFSLIRLNRGHEALGDVVAIAETIDLKKCDERSKTLYSFVYASSGVKHMIEGDFSKAKSYFSSALALVESFQNYFNLGICQSKLDNTDQALKAFKKAKSMDKDNWKVDASIGTIYNAIEDYDAGIKAFKTALKHPEGKVDAEVNFNLAATLIRLERDAEAKPYLEQVVALDPNHWVAHSLLGTVAISKEDLPSALEYLQTAANLPGGDTDSTLHFNLGFCQFKLGKLADALKSFDKAVECNPENQQAVDAANTLRPIVGAGVKNTNTEGVTLEDGLDAAEIEVLLAPLEAAKVAITPQRPEYMNRSGLSSIEIGHVQKLTDHYNKLALESKRKNRGL